MIEEVLVKLGLDKTALGQGLREAEHQVDEFSHAVQENLLDSVKELAAPLMGFGIVSGIERLFGKVDEIKQVADATGLTAEQYQRFAFAAKEAGLQSEQTSKSLEFLSKTIGEASTGQKAQIEIFDRWGIAVKDANGETRQTADILDDISDAMADMTSPAEKAAMAQDLMGKSGAKMVSLLKSGSESIKEIGKEATVLTDKEISEIDKAKENIEELENKLTIIGGKLAAVVSSLGGEGSQIFEVFGGKDAVNAETNRDMAEKLRAHAQYVDHQRGTGATAPQSRQIDSYWGTPVRPDGSPIEQHLASIDAKLGGTIKVEHQFQ